MFRLCYYHLLYIFHVIYICTQHIKCIQEDTSMKAEEKEEYAEER